MIRWVPGAGWSPALPVAVLTAIALVAVRPRVPVRALSPPGTRRAPVSPLALTAPVVGALGVMTMLTAGLAPTAVVVVLLGGILARRPRVERRRRAARIERTLPDTVELFVLTVRAGLLPRDALRVLQPVVEPIIGEAFSDVLARCARGQRFADALSAIPERLGARALMFADALAAAERTGLPLGPSLDRLADDARQHRRQLAEQAARELPVRLSFPLVVCTLPAFVLLAVVPLLLGAISSFTTG